MTSILKGITLAPLKPYLIGAAVVATGMALGGIYWAGYHAAHKAAQPAIAEAKGDAAIGTAQATILGTDLTSAAKAKTLETSLRGKADAYVPPKATNPDGSLSDADRAQLRGALVGMRNTWRPGDADQGGLEPASAPPAR